MPVRKVKGGYKWGNTGKVYPIVKDFVPEYHCPDFEPRAKEEKYEKCLKCQYVLTSYNAYPCNHCNQGRANHFIPRLKAGEQE